MSDSAKKEFSFKVKMANIGDQIFSLLQKEVANFNTNKYIRPQWASDLALKSIKHDDGIEIKDTNIRSNIMRRVNQFAEVGTWCPV